jgi:hypothetical protein
MDPKQKKPLLDKFPRLKKLVENELSDAMSLRVKMCWIVAVMWVLLQLALIKIIFLILNRAITDVEMIKQIFTVLRDFYSYGNVVFLVWIIVYMLGKQDVHLKVLGIIDLEIGNGSKSDNAYATPSPVPGSEASGMIVPTGDTRTGE